MQMEALDYWHLCSELSVIEATLLVVGLDPSECAAQVEKWAPHLRPMGYEATKRGIFTALRNGEIKGYWAGDKFTPEFAELMGGTPEDLALEKSWVAVASLRDWLTERGVKSGFVFRGSTGRPDYLDPSHPRYAPKLAAAVKAWLAMENEPAVSLSPKKALERWLREHAAELDLIGKKGKPNTTGIQEISKVANWQPAGGAPKIPF